MNTEQIRKLIFTAVEEAVDDLLYDDRSADEELPAGVIEEAVRKSDIGIWEIVFRFEELIRRKIPGGTEGYEATQAAHTVRNERLAAEAERIREQFPEHA